MTGGRGHPDSFSAMPWRLRATAILLGAAVILALASARSADAAQTVRVGLYENPPKIFIAPDGRPDGLFIDIIKGITAAADLQVDYVRCVWRQCLELLESGAIDVMPDVAYSDERAQRFRFSRIPVFHSWSVVYTHDGSGIGSIVDLHNRRVAVLANSIQEEVMSEEASRFGVVPDLIKYSTFDEMFVDLRDRKVDAALFNRFVGAWRAKEFGIQSTPIIFSPATVYFAYSNSLDESVSAIIDSTLEAQMGAQGSAYEAALRDWFYDYRPPFIPVWAYWAVAVIATLLVIAAAFMWGLRRVVRKTRAELRERIAEIRRTEAQLAQSQKMEAVGQLTGGVAHDFNNLLTVVLGNAALLVEALERDPELRSQAELVYAAAQRGANLTRRLLAFSLKQVLEPRSTDVNRLVGRMDGLLRSALGGQVEITTVLSKDLWPATVDPAQLESAILNLAVNARDAMPGGGSLRIETENRGPDERHGPYDPEERSGSYVVVTVSDSGGGMTPEVAARAVEPFFTTKEVGKGTGLGLSMVYGFVKQSGGFLTLTSELGRGTTVKLFLPRADAADAPGAVEDTAAAAPGGTETILVVEDDDMVRTHVERQLRSLGYRVRSARDGPAALAILGSPEEIDLMFTDVVMPGGMNGAQLVAAAQRLRPTLRVLYTSGYSDDAIVRQIRRDPGFELLGKPYRRQDLAARLRRVLNGRAPAR